MQKKKERTFEEKFNLFCLFINDINNYFEKKLIIENIPKNFNILDDLKLDTKIYKLIRKNNLNEMDRKELERRKIIDNKRKGIKVQINKKITDEQSENVILNGLNKSINNKSNLNPSYFGQTNFKIINHFFYSKNEIIELRKIMKKKIHDLLYECYENVKDPFDHEKIIRKDKKNIIKKDSQEEKKKERKNLLKNESEKLLNKKNEINLLSFQYHSEDNMNDKFFHQILNNSLKINKEKIKNIENKNIYHSNNNIFNRSRNIQLVKNKNSELYNTPLNSNNKHKKFLFTNSREIKFLNTNHNYKTKLLKPKTAIRRIQNISLDLNKISNNFVCNKNSLINNTSKSLFGNSLVRNAISESNFNLENFKKKWDMSERNERKPNEKKLVYSSSIDGKNYDYSNLMSLRHIKLKSKFKKYPNFCLTKNVFFSQPGTVLPSLINSLNKNKKKVYSIYNIRNNLKIQKMKGK